MDKRKVIAAYRRGMINVQECAQILGIDMSQITRLINDPYLAVEPQLRRGKQSVNG
ncbi:putative DNA-binding transcriptional regulator AlpA [Paenibacillus phyllosphaerae]|uniref:Putative DNA-binding transcriptional regulator AlpA n=1 Tax=Paenibacillus phyllosphaerae TaxID=274593 RepID=A0A7W5FLQ6_9BACL|nr:hypothetical protein [Paenibacillus phyllosphaerae]MBB3109287.1 putative DNA-binding transcriptional regulator AlpA [Paenibacillus phyllosphaerae]